MAKLPAKKYNRIVHRNLNKNLQNILKIHVYGRFCASRKGGTGGGGWVHLKQGRVWALGRTEPILPISSTLIVTKISRHMALQSMATIPPPPRLSTICGSKGDQCLHVHVYSSGCLGRGGHDQISQAFPP